MKTKICTKCKEEKDISEFSKDNKTKDGLTYWCKKCCKKYRKNNKEHKKELRKYKKEYRKEHKKELRNYNKKYYQNNKEHFKEHNQEYYQKNTENIKEYYKKYYQDNLEKYRERQKRFLLIPKNRLSNNISFAIWFSLKGNKNGRRWEDLVGYILKDLMAHLESLFQSDMNWNNYGMWHIDHIRPIASFNFNSYEDNEFKQCWALENLQPLWASENLRKSSIWKGVDWRYGSTNHKHHKAY